MILVNAQSNRTEKLGVFAKYVPLAIPIGLGMLSGYLLNKGIHVKIWDEAVEMLTGDDMHDLTAGCQRPYIFGISCMTASIARGRVIAKMIRETLPDAFIIFGGIHPTVLPDDIIQSGLADFVIRKEGEIPLERLYLALKGGTKYEDIPNLSFAINGIIRHNPTISGPDMDSLPPFPYYLFDKYQARYDFGFVVGSRGCPYNCIFCSQRSITGKRVTYRSPQKIVDDIELLANKYCRQLITFSDDNMLTHKKRIQTMCDLIQERGLHQRATFQAQVRGDDITEDILKRLKAASFITLDFGLETASERLMQILKKNETVETNREALQMAKDFGFQLSGTFILGLPTETKADRRASYQMARQYLDYVRFNNATPYPGTKLYEIAKEEGGLNPGKDWENLNACGTLVEGGFSKKHLAYVPAGTSEMELKTDILKYNLLFSFRWKVIRDLLNRKKGTAGWFKMQKHWYLNCREWIHFIRLALTVIQRWIELFVMIISSNLSQMGRSLKPTWRRNRN